MIEIILNRLIIIAGQWQEFGGSQYELEFESGLCELQEVTRGNRETVVQLLLNHIQGVTV